MCFLYTKHFFLNFCEDPEKGFTKCQKENSKKISKDQVESIKLKRSEKNVYVSVNICLFILQKYIIFMVLTYYKRYACVVDSFWPWPHFNGSLQKNHACLLGLFVRYYEYNVNYMTVQLVYRMFGKRHAWLIRFLSRFSLIISSFSLILIFIPCILDFQHKVIHYK